MGLSCASKWERKSEENRTADAGYVGLSAVPLFFFSLRHPLFSGGLRGEEPEQHMTLRFRGCQHIVTYSKNTLTHGGSL